MTLNENHLSIRNMWDFQKLTDNEKKVVKSKFLMKYFTAFSNILFLFFLFYEFCVKSIHCNENP